MVRQSLVIELQVVSTLSENTPRRAGGPSEAWSTAPRILGVDDRALLLASLKHAFGQQGWKVATAADAVAAEPADRGDGL